MFQGATGSRPSRGRDLAERDRGLSIDHALHIVERRVRFAVRVAAKRMLGTMLAGVPAPDRQVQSPGEGNRVVNHHNLLMLGRSQGKAGVQAKSNSAVTSCGELFDGIPFPLGCIKRCEIPDQNVDPERPVST